MTQYSFEIANISSSEIFIPSPVNRLLGVGRKFTVTVDDQQEITRNDAINSMIRSSLITVTSASVPVEPVAAPATISSTGIPGPAGPMGPAGSGSELVIEQYITPGSFTGIFPPAGAQWLTVWAIGGGGGGGGASEGGAGARTGGCGGSGGAANLIQLPVPEDTLSVVVGSGGAGGVGGVGWSYGAAGGDSVVSAGGVERIRSLGGQGGNEGGNPSTSGETYGTQLGRAGAIGSGTTACVQVFDAPNVIMPYVDLRSSDLLCTGGLGGGAGAGTSAGDLPVAGCAGGAFSRVLTRAGGTYNVAQNGGNGSAPFGFFGSTGGGGGGTGFNGGNGGDGTVTGGGGGGGGGGGHSHAGTGGSGGRGGHGAVWLLWWTQT